MSERTEKLPAILFYPGDWNSDAKLKLCSLAAQALWMRMLCVMHTCEPYGHLTFKDMQPATAKETAQVTGVHTNRVTPLVTELERNGVLSRTQGGVIYSRRMVRDYAKRLINQQNGQKGGNPQFRNSVNPPVKPSVKAGVIPISFAVSKEPPVSPPSFPASACLLRRTIDGVRTSYRSRNLPSSGYVPSSGSGRAIRPWSTGPT